MFKLFLLFCVVANLSQAFKLEKNCTMRQEEIAGVYKQFEGQVKALYHLAKPRCFSNLCYHLTHMLIQDGRHQLSNLYKTENPEKFCADMNNVDSGTFKLAHIISGSNEKALIVDPAKQLFMNQIEALKIHCTI